MIVFLYLYFEFYFKYIYDAWGNHVCRILSNNGEYVDNSDNETYNYISNINPFRYRGYYYDTETGLYYLNSRYYDPQTGRFINADDISMLDVGKDVINGLNLYVYCLLNPINTSDDNGDLPKWLKWLSGICIIIIAVAVSVATAGIGTAITGALGGGLGASILGGAVGGAISGAIASFGISLGIQGISNGFNNINWVNIGLSTLTGFVSGAILGGIGGAIKYFSSTTKLYRAVSNAEYNSIKSTGKFSLKAGAFEGKQFGFSLNEVRNYANLPFNNGVYSKIVGIRVPKIQLNSIMQKTITDSFVFKSGVATIFDINKLNEIIKILKFFSL